MELPKYTGNYLGIVVQNNDPLRQGRVKVFVPHISPTIYEGWTDRKEDVKFKFLGANIDSDLSEILDDLKKVLPWAQVALPVVGEMASGRYNDTIKAATTSDTNNIEEILGKEGNSKPEIGSNIDQSGEKTGAIFDQNAFMLGDAFNNPAETNVNNVNKLSFNYKPETYSNLAKGAFAIPRVGAHVWVFFNEGNPLKPVIFAATYGRDDWRGIYDYEEEKDLGQDYPGEYENFTRSDTESQAKTEYTINTETYRNKYVINQKGGTMAFVNTDNREMLKMTHYSGSFLEFNNQATIALATNNDQKLVIGDSFLTVRGTRNEFSQMDYDNVIQGDHYRKVGDPGKVLLHQEWKSIMSEIADIKQLFDIMRCDPVFSPGASPASNVAGGSSESSQALLAQGRSTPTPGISTSLFKLNSSRQKRVGTPRLCPVCTAVTDGGVDVSVNNYFDEGDVTGTFGFKAEPAEITTKEGDGSYGSTLTSGGVAHIRTNTTQRPTFGQDGRVNVNNGIAALVDCEGKPLFKNPGYLHSLMGDMEDFRCPVCNPKNPTFPNTMKGLSPSSYYGVWQTDPEKKMLNAKYASVLPKLAAIESTLGKGGTEVIEIEKNKIENIGLVMNDFGAIRVDMFGKMEPAVVQVFPAYTRIIPSPSPLIEVVQVDDLPGGTYSLNVANKYNLLVGAGGVNMKSYGVINIAGAITNISGEQVNVGSALEVNIDGGKRLSLVADIVSIAQRERQQVLIDSDLGVSGKTVIRGPVYVEGTLYYQESVCVGKMNNTNQSRIHSAGYQSNSPPTPMGSIITSDRTHKYKGKKNKDGIQLGEGDKPTYLGYAGKSRAIGCLPEDVFVGVIPSGTKVLASCTATVAGSFGILPVTMTDITFESPVPVIAKKNLLTAEVATAYAGTDPGTEPKAIEDILEDLKEKGDDLDFLKALGSENKGMYIPGAGYGDEGKQENLPLRGLPSIQRDKMKALFAAKDTRSVPAIVYGDGADWDAIKSAPQSLTFLSPAAGLEASNLAVRTKFVKSGGTPQVVGHGDYSQKINHTP